MKDLRAYTQPGRGDLAACVERVLDNGGPPARPPVTLEEIDDLLITLAGHSIFSDPSILQLPQCSSEARDVLLGNILKRLTPSEAKWLIRLVLKDLSPLKLDEPFILRSFHFLLPDLLRFQATFSSAVALLRGPLREYPERPDPRSERLLRKQAAPLIKPDVGVKVGRPEFMKARSIDHCLKMLGKKQWVLERKYDGEYCEVHIDLSVSTDPAKCIKIFSKSGKDSTLDRKGIHQTLLRCLKLGRAESKIKRRAVILGELFVWSDQEKEPMPFDKIRKFVTRSGVRIGTDADSQRQPDEHLAIAFFDLLLLDEEIVMTKPIEERRQWLRETYTKIEGRALGAQWKVVDFADEGRSKRVLLQQFAASNAGRCEGLVLKPCGLPYFALHSQADGYKHGFIKLKSDYISEMGDEADFAVVGASYNAQQALKSGLKGLKWTDFHLGAMLNKEDVLRFGTRPHFRMVGTIQQSFCVPKPVLKTANIIGNLSAEPYDPDQQPPTFDLHNPSNVKIDTVFRTPLVFEVLGAGFQKASNSDFYMLRHARVKKLHQDRSWKDCISFQELQDQATAARTAPVASESQETRQWIERLERKCRRKFEREKTATPGSTSMSNAPTSNPPPSNGPPAHRLRGLSPNKSLVDITATEERQPLRHVPNNSIRSQSSTGSHPHARGASSSVDKSLPNTRPTAITAIAKRKLNETDHTPCPAPKRPCVSVMAKLAQAASIGQQQEAHMTRIDRGHSAVSCSKVCPPSCQLSNATVYLASCLRHTPYITQTLLPAHSPLALVPCLSHWDRASFTHDRLSDTVSESQSYPGMRKVVLVESKRDEATQNVIKNVLALNCGRFEERVEVWDWRVLETLGLAGGHALGKTGRNWFLGATIWDEGKAGSVFVWNGARF